MANALVRDAALQAAPRPPSAASSSACSRAVRRAGLRPDLGGPRGRHGGPGARADEPAGHHRVGRLQRHELPHRRPDADPGGRPQSRPCGPAQAEADGRPPAAALRGFRALLRRGRHDADNLRLYDRFVAPHLEPAVRDYWAGRDLAGRRRIAMFRRNLYRHGLLGRTIQLGHAGLPAARQAAAAHARRPRPRRAAPAVRERAGAGVRQPARAPVWPTCRLPISASASRRPSSTR